MMYIKAQINNRKIPIRIYRRFIVIRTGCFLSISVYEVLSFCLFKQKSSFLLHI